jgi:hypothetical protein
MNLNFAASVANVEHENPKCVLLTMVCVTEKLSQFFFLSLGFLNELKKIGAKLRAFHVEWRQAWKIC